jgi:hypothetical protein
MGLLGKLFGRKDDDDEGTGPTITLDLERRRPQLLRLEQSLDVLARTMRDGHTAHDPGWRGRINEYNQLAGEAMTLRRGTPTREDLLDLVFSIRPVFSGPIPPGMEAIGPLQDEVMAAANDMRDLLPGERG